MNAASSLGAVAIAMGLVSAAVANEAPCAMCDAPPTVSIRPSTYTQDAPSTWIFRRSNYTHDPETGARVAQYQRLPAIQPLEDERLVTSRYHTTRTTLRGTGGSIETYYDVQSWGNGRGGLDAEWERFHDAWKESYLQGSFYNQGQGFGKGFPNQFGSGFNGPWNSGPWSGGPWNNGPWNGGPWNGGPWNGGPWNCGPWNNWNQGPWWHGNGHGHHDNDGHDDNDGP